MYSIRGDEKFFSEKELDNLQNIAKSGIMLRSELEPFIYYIMNMMNWQQIWECVLKR